MIVGSKDDSPADYVKKGFLFAVGGALFWLFADMLKGSDDDDDDDNDEDD